MTQNTAPPPTADILYLHVLPVRIAAMVRALVQHQAVICAYDAGCVRLHYKGSEVKPHLENVALTSQTRPAP
jgi:hypothetical protein